MSSTPLSGLTARVAAANTVGESTSILLHGISTNIQRAKGDSTKLEELSTYLTNNVNALGDALLANTAEMSGLKTPKRTTTKSAAAAPAGGQASELAPVRNAKSATTATKKTPAPKKAAPAKTAKPPAKGKPAKKAAAPKAAPIAAKGGKPRLSRAA